MPTELAPAKINWYLKVTGKRPDGFHEINSLMQCLTLADTLEFKPSRRLEVLTEAPINAADNLVMKAALALRGAAGCDLGARITLHKRIPIAAGLGGGSSDAAATLLGLIKLWGLQMDAPALSDIAAGLGSDVPFFLGGGSALVSGRGEVVKALNTNIKPLNLLLVNPGFGVSAGWAYSALKSFSAKDAIGEAAFIEALGEGDVERMGSIGQNDLEPQVIAAHPEVGGLKSWLMDAGAGYVLMSGSGPTVFGVFRNEQEALKAKDALGQDGKFSAFWSAVARTDG